MSNATAADILPIFTVCLSDALGLMYCLYISMVNMVDVEFNIEAKEDTIAAAKAAKAKPF